MSITLVSLLSIGKARITSLPETGEFGIEYLT